MEVSPNNHHNLDLEEFMYLKMRRSWSLISLVLLTNIGLVAWASSQSAQSYDFGLIDSYVLQPNAQGLVVFDQQAAIEAGLTEPAIQTAEDWVAFVNALSLNPESVFDTEIGRSLIVAHRRTLTADPAWLSMLLTQMDPIEGIYPHDLAERISAYELFELLQSQVWSPTQIQGLMAAAAQGFEHFLVGPELPFYAADAFPELDEVQVVEALGVISVIYQRAFRFRLRQWLLSSDSSDWGHCDRVLSDLELAEIAIDPLRFRSNRVALRMATNPIPSCGYSNRTSVHNVQSRLHGIYDESSLLLGRTQTAIQDLTDIKEKVEKVEDVCGKLVTAKEKADQANTVITILKPLPYVGQVATAAGLALNVVRTPLKTVYNPAKTLKPKMTTAKTTLGSLIDNLENAADKLETLMDETVRTDTVICYGDNCATGATLDALAARIADAATATENTLAAINNAITNVEDWIDVALPQLDFVTPEFTATIDLVSINLDALLNPLVDLYNGLNIRLCDPFGWVCVDLMDFLDSTIGWIVDYISQFIDPLLQGLWDALDVIDMPELPDMSGLIDLDLPNIPSFDLSIHIEFDPCSYALDIVSCIPALSTLCPGLDYLQVGTNPTGKFVDGNYITTPYGNGYRVDTEGSSQYGYTFYGHLSNRVTAIFGRVVGAGHFRQSDTFYGSLPQGRRYLKVYAIDSSGNIAGSTEVLNYTHGTSWRYRTFTISGLTSGQRYWIAVGRGDSWSTDWKLAAEWANLIAL